MSSFRFFFAGTYGDAAVRDMYAKLSAFLNEVRSHPHSADRDFRTLIYLDVVVSYRTLTLKCSLLSVLVFPDCN